MSLPFRVNWRSREEPRVPAGVLASGAVARRLVVKILDLDDSFLARWQGAAISDAVVLLGESESLPWVDGVDYLGWDERAPHLLLPTNRDPDVPLDLLERTLVQHSPFPPPLAVIPARNLIISLSRARALSREILTSWLGGAA
jgi:hypothetical protein